MPKRIIPLLILLAAIAVSVGFFKNFCARDFSGASGARLENKPGVSPAVAGTNAVSKTYDHIDYLHDTAPQEPPASPR